MDSPNQLGVTRQFSISTSKSLVEAYLDEYFVEKQQNAALIDSAYEQLWQSIHSLYVAGGKRLRPYVTLLIYKGYAANKDMSAVIPAAAATELIHLAMLIHDDIIDRDRVRYGIPNVSGQYDEIYKSALPNVADRTHFADSAAILAGDLLLSDAYLLLGRCKYEASIILEAQKFLNEAVFTVVGGELLDTESAFGVQELIRPLDIARLKTASYTFVSPMLIGATFARASSDQQQLLQTLGTTMGIAYQLQDDYLGMFGDSKTTGKSTTSDLREGKYTHLIQLFYSLASTKQRKTFSAAFGSSAATDEQYMTAKQLLIESGAQAALVDRLKKLEQTALEVISQLGIGEAEKALLEDLVEETSRRKK